MNFFNSFLTSNNDVEFRDLESGERSGNAIYPPLPPTSFNNLGNILTYPTPDAATSMEVESGGSMQQAELGMQAEKHSRQLDPVVFGKVRIVPQTSRIPTVRELSKRFEVKLQRSNMDLAEKAEEHMREMRELKQLLDAAEQRISEEKAQRAEEKMLYEEEIVRVREEGNRQVEQVRKIAEEITQRVKEEASQQTEERRHHVEEIKRVREEGNRRVEQIADMAKEISRQAKEEANWRNEERINHNEEIERINKEWKLREEEIFKRAQEGVEEKIWKAVKEAMMMERRNGNPHTESQDRVFQNVVEESDWDGEDLDEIPIAGASNVGMNQRVEQMKSVQPSRVHFEEDTPAPTTEVEEMDLCSQVETREEDEEVEIIMNSQDEESDTTDMENDIPLPKRYSEPVSIHLQRDHSEDLRMSSQDEDANMSTNEVIPPPRRYSAPKGGAAPVNIRLRRAQREQSEDNSVTAEISSTAELHPRERIGRTKKSQQPQQIFGDDYLEENYPVVHKRPTKKKIYPQSSLRGYNPLRAARLTTVRDSMNRLMNITADAEIHKVNCATEEEADDFEEGYTEGPELNPMRPYLETGRNTKWNYELCELFVEHFQEEQEVILSKSDIDIVEDMFLARLSRLSRTWREYQAHTPEAQEEKGQRTKELARRNTRRVDLYNNRLAVCYGNLKNRDGTTDLGWKATTEMVEQLGPAGMSSDESEVDATTKKTTYKIRKRHWRSTECKDRLLIIDADRNVTNALGGARPGNPARERVRVSNTTISERAPTVGCPKNYYSKAWVSNLGSRRMVEALEMKENKDLGEVL